MTVVFDFAKIEDMKLYQTIDGTLIGFYQEKGGAVQAVLYRDLFEQQLVTKTREEEVIVAGYFEQVEKIVPGYWKEDRVFIQGHYERQMVWHPEYSVTRYREVPGHYETQRIWVPEYYVTRYYWREAHPARGLEAAWIPYQHLIPAGFKDQRVWVDTYTEPYQEIIPAGERETRVWIDGRFETEKTWIPETKTTEAVWREPKIEYKTVEYKDLENVWVGREPVYEYIDPMFTQAYEVLELIEAPADRPDLEDVITIRNTETGEVLRTTATYIGLGEQIDENEYVVP